MEKHEIRPPTYTPYTRIHSKWLKELYISCDTIKVLEENIGSKISDTLRSNIFTDISPRAREIKETINKWDYIKVKSFCIAKENISRMKKGIQPYGKTFLPMIPQTRVWSPKYIKNSYDSTPGRQTIQLKNGRRTWIDTSPKGTYRGPIDIWKKCSASLAIREIQIKTAMRYHLTPAIINKSTNDKCW